MTVILLLLALAAALILASLLAPDVGFERQLDDLHALRDARTNPARWLR